MGVGDRLTTAVSNATQSAKQTASSMIDSAARGAQALEQSAQSQANAAAQKLSEWGTEAKSAAVAGGQAALEAGKKAADATEQGAKWFGNGVASSFTRNGKGFFCLPCAMDKAQNITGHLRYLGFQGKKVRICTDASGGQTAEIVQRQPDGSYSVVGRIQPTTNPDGTTSFSHGDVWNPVTPVDPPRNVPSPVAFYGNGMNNTPGGALGSATRLQREIHQRCPDVARQKEQSQSGGKSCEGCECLLFEYSQSIGFLPDVGQCILGKFGWGGLIASDDANMMRDAIGRPDGNGHVTMAVQSRGSIFLDNAWGQVFGELVDQHIHDAGAIAAGQRARSEFLALMQQHPPSDAAVSVSQAADIIAQDAQRRWASEYAAGVMNQHVTVIESGAAVYGHNPLQQGVIVYATDANGHRIDAVNVIAGEGGSGQMQGSPVQVPGAGRIPSFSNHDFDVNYVNRVSYEVCKH